MKWLVLSIAFISLNTPFASAHADHNHKNLRSDIKELRKEVRQLKQNIARLEQVILHLSSNQAAAPTLDPNKLWSCYINDYRAGGFVASGANKAEATGKVLVKCTQKGGSCNQINVKCSKSEL